MRLAKLTTLEALYVCRNLRAGDRREALATMPNDDLEGLAVEAARSWGSFCWSVWTDDGRVVAFIGATEQWRGCWRAWMLATDDFKEVGKGLTSWIKSFMIPKLIENGAHRIEAFSIEGHPVAHRWLVHLGFAQEARLRRYGRNGEDFFVFSILPEVGDVHFQVEEGQSA